MIYKADAINRKRDYICACGFIGRGKVQGKGSRKLEIFLWAVLLIPGPFYSAWRYFSRRMICPKCQSPGLIPLDSPKGQAMFDQAMHQDRPWGRF